MASQKKAKSAGETPPTTITGESPSSFELKKEIFCREFIVSLNATKAYVAAGHKDTNSKYKNAYTYLARPDIQARIDELKNERIKRLEINADRVAQELIAVGLADIGELVEWNGEAITVKDSTKLDTRAVMQIDCTKQTIHSGDTPITTINHRIRLHDKVATLKILAEHLKMVGPKREDEGDGNDLAMSFQAGYEFRKKRMEEQAKKGKKDSE